MDLRPAAKASLVSLVTAFPLKTLLLLLLSSAHGQAVQSAEPGITTALSSYSTEASSERSWKKEPGSTLGTVVLKEGYQHEEEEGGKHRLRRVLEGDVLATPTKPRILVYIITFCGFNSPPATTQQAVNSLFFNGTGGRQRSLAGYMSTCSYGQVALQPENVKVMGPVEVPCNGTLQPPLPFGSSPDFTTTSCSNNLWKWHYWLDSWAKRNYGVNAADYHHRVIIFPSRFASETPGCDFSGMGSQGRRSYDHTASNSWGSALVWMAGEYWDSLETLLHEIGHNYGMGHASGSGCISDQCDHTCIMGATMGQGIRCFNAAHNWQIGWGSPFLQIGDSGLPYGLTTEVRIPAQLSTRNSSVSVVLSDMPRNQILFLSTRLNVYPYDLAWYNWFDNVPYLLMHTYAGSTGEDSTTTFYEGEIGVGSVWRDSSSSVVVRFDSWERVTGVATVRICRRRSDVEMQCGDGLDDDCDFVPDVNDPDCFTVPPGTRSIPPVRQKPPRPPPSPPPLPPPSPPSPPSPPRSPSPPPRPSKRNAPPPKSRPPPNPKPPPSHAPPRPRPPFPLPPSPRPTPPPGLKPPSPPSPRRSPSPRPRRPSRPPPRPLNPSRPPRLPASPRLSRLPPSPRR